MTGLRDQWGNPVEIFYVINRLTGDTNGGVRTATCNNLRALGFPLPDATEDPAVTHLFMGGQPIPPAVSGKEYDHYDYVRVSRRRTPILWLGDNCSDFLKEYGNAANCKDRITAAQAETRWGQPGSALARQRRRVRA